MEYGKSELIRLLRNVPREGWSNQKLKDLIDSLWRNPVLLRWSGFVHAGGPDTEMEWDNATKIFSIGPVQTSFSFYQYVNKLSLHRRFEVQQVDISADIAEGFWLFYFGYNDETVEHELMAIHNPTEAQTVEIYLTKTIVSSLYYDATAHEAIYFGDERHGSEWNPQIHVYLHNAFGARRKTGLQLTGMTINGDGSLDAHARYTVTGGTILHDDFEMAIPQAGNTDTIPVLYFSGANHQPRFVTEIGFGVYSPSNVGYNSNSSAIIAAADGNYVMYHIFATNEIAIAARKVVAVMGQQQYSDLEDAYVGIDPELDIIAQYMPQAGRCYVGTIIFQTDIGFTNAVKARIITNIKPGIGPQGPQGAQGAQGTGTQGAQGAQGYQGVAGTGTQGPQGAQGVRGSQWKASSGDPNSLGVSAIRYDMYLDRATGNVWEFSTSWIQTTNIKGPQGAQGAAGVGTQGPQGAQGAAGVGTQGPQGAQGAGTQGAQGAQGHQGSQGYQGFQGMQSFIAGPQGPQGYQGANGSGVTRSDNQIPANSGVYFLFGNTISISYLAHITTWICEFIDTNGNYLGRISMLVTAFYNNGTPSASGYTIHTSGTTGLVFTPTINNGRASVLVQNNNAYQVNYQSVFY